MPSPFRALACLPLVALTGACPAPNRNTPETPIEVTAPPPPSPTSTATTTDADRSDPNTLVRAQTKPPHANSDEPVAKQFKVITAGLPPDLLPAKAAPNVLNTSKLKRSSTATWDVQAFRNETKLLPELGERAEGVLYMAGRGSSVYLRQKAEPFALMVFGVDDLRPYWPYFSSDGKRGRNPMSNWGVQVGSASNRGSRKFNVSGLDEKLAAEFGLDRVAQLVELEINAGAGAPGKHFFSHFVATEGRILDGTMRYPMRVDDVLQLLHQRFMVNSEQRMTDLKFRRLEKSLVSKGHKVFKRLERLNTSPSWDAATKTLTVKMDLQYVTVVRGPTKSGNFAKYCQSTCPPGAPCQNPCPGGPPNVFTQHVLRQHRAVVYAVKLDGHLLAENIFQYQAAKQGPDSVVEGRGGAYSPAPFPGFL